MASKLDIINAALNLIGADPVNDLTENTTEASSAEALYEVFLLDELAKHPWRFSMKQVDLGAPDATSPEGRWDYRYAEPAGTIAVRAVTVSDEPIAFDRYDGYIYCDAGTDVDAIADVQYRPNEANFSAGFVGAFTYRLASLFASSVTGKADLAKLWAGEAERAFAKARLKDSQQQTTRKVRTNRFLVNRR